MTAAIEVEGVSKRFRLYKEKYTSLKERILHGGKIPYNDFWALQDINLEIAQGETLGIVGRNGCGKSTLLKCIAGILKPTEGEIRLRGQLAAMLELGAGFQPELSGRDNIYLNAALLGMASREIDKRFDDIVAFAELEEFIDNQVRFYSSGMYVRLGFAVAVNVDPDILLVDEVLAVGDERFQQKCMRRIHDFQEQGRTIVVVSHAVDTLRQICNRVAVIEAGQLVTVDSPANAIAAFRDTLLAIGESDAIPAIAEDPAVGFPGEPQRSGATRRVTLSGGRLETTVDRPKLYPGEAATVVVDIDASEDLRGVAFGFSVWGSNGTLIFDYDSGQAVDLPRGRSTIRFHFDAVPLLDGTYSINVRVQDPHGGVVHARLEPAATMQLQNPGTSTGLISLPVRLEVTHEHRPGDPLLAEQVTT